MYPLGPVYLIPAQKFTSQSTTGMIEAQQQTLARIHPATIEMGPIPFSLYASESGNKIVLFCRSGFPITERHKRILERVDRTFYISSAEIDAYYDYSLRRFSKISTSPDVPIEEKNLLIKNIGKRLVRRLYSDPRSQEAMRQSGNFVEGYLDLILSNDIALNSLFSASTTASYTLSHSINVCTFCLLIGEQLYGMDKRKLWPLSLGGLLLDLGMSILEPDRIDSKGPLKKNARSILRNHPIKTQQLLAEHKLPSDVLSMCRSHHERYDGSGYPDGLKGEEIHAFARIGAVADVYDAMTSPRSHRKQHTHVQALAEMSLNKHLFDPVALGTLLRLVLQHEKLVQKFLRGGPDIEKIAKSG